MDVVAAIIHAPLGPSRLETLDRIDNMPITVKYFASLREQCGAERELEAPESGATVADVWARAGNAEPMPENVLMAVNLEYVGADHPVEDGDEVAFFPPVTGG